MCRTWGAARRIAVSDSGKYRRPGARVRHTTDAEEPEGALTWAAIAPLSFLRLVPDASAGLEVESFWAGRYGWEAGVGRASLIFRVGDLSPVWAAFRLSKAKPRGSSTEERLCLLVVPVTLTRAEAGGM
jgi:hypothetical protein